jgi:DNA-directed RNA polymerase specialized sigma subunit
MNRRQMVILPGAALAASAAFSQTLSGAVSSASGNLSHKAIARYSRIKTSYKVPKSARKQAKYISFLSTLLTLSPGQQAEAASIFATAGAAEHELKQTVKAHKKSLRDTVTGNDVAAIGRASSAIGLIAAQRHLIGAKANAAFIQILTPDQQSTFSQFKS